MRRITRQIICAVTIPVAFAAVSCEHKELCYDHSHTVPVDVIFDWTNAADADPSIMEVYFFPQDGGKAHRVAFQERNGGTVELPYGTYDVLCLNTDTETILYRDTDAWETFGVYTRNASLLEGMGMMSVSEPPVPSGAENQNGALEPDMLWTDRKEGLVVTYTERQTVTLYPEQSVTRFTLEIQNAENIEHASALSGSLSGLGSGFRVGTGRTDAEIVTVPFSVNTDKVSVITADFRGFGHCPDGENGIPHMLVIYAIMGDGSKLYYTYDVTDQIHSAQDQRNIHILLDGLPLPVPITDGNGIVPSVDDWDDVIVDLPM